MLCARSMRYQYLSIYCVVRMWLKLCYLFVFCLCQQVKATKMRRFPDGIKFGVASAAYQIEGAWDAADKSPSIWDTFSHQPNKISDNTTGDDACDSYKYYKRDIEMIKFLGVDVYRFSISWPRVLPTGFPNKISEEGSKYYNNLIDGLLANGIEPILTMYHWDLPQSLQDLGGWANPLIADWFEDYARVLYTLYGDRVKTWITLNEPKQFGIYGYGMTRFAPGINSHGTGEYMVVKNMLLAHAKAWHLYDEKFRPEQKGIIGITIATDFREGMTDSPEDVAAGQEAMDFEVGLYSHPIFTTEGGFPESVIRLVAKRSAEQGFRKSRLPELSREEIEYIKGTSDFYGFNHYSTRFYTRKDFVPGTYPIPSYNDDLGATFNYKDYVLAPVIHTTEIPEGIRKALNWVKKTCNNPPIMITENGFGTYGGLNDQDRIKYLYRYMDSALDAVELDGCNVTMYTVWSLMDNFEWSSGLRYNVKLPSRTAVYRKTWCEVAEIDQAPSNYVCQLTTVIPRISNCRINRLSMKFGIFETDYEDPKKTRRPKLSAFWYQHLIETRTLDPDFRPKLENIEF